MESSFFADLPQPGDRCQWYDLDWSASFIVRRSNLLTNEQRWYIQQIDERVKKFPESFGGGDRAEDDYRTVAYMIAMACSRNGLYDRDASADLSFKNRFLQCRQIPFKTRQGVVHFGGVCGQRRLCPFCNYRLRQEALLTYVPAFDRGRWYSMTVSSTADLDLELDELTCSWDAAKAVVRAQIDAGHFRGAYWTEELHLRSLWPEIRVLPHSHVLFHAAEHVDEAAVQVLAEQTFRRYFTVLRRRAARVYPREDVTLLEPDIQMERLDTKQRVYGASEGAPAVLGVREAKKALYKWCDYLTKTMRVVDAYKDALANVGDEERWRANVQFEQFLHGVVLMSEEDTPPRKEKRRAADESTIVFKPRSRIQRHSLGTLRPGRSRSFIGIRPRQRPDHQHEIDELRREIREERSARLGDDFDIDERE